MSDSLFDGLSWADQIDLEEQLLESRYPGRAIQLHEKLSSPARKREPQEAFKVHQEKQKNAKMRRLKFQDEKATKLSALNARIEEVIAQVCRNFLKFEIDLQFCVSILYGKGSESSLQLKMMTSFGFPPELEA